MNRRKRTIGIVLLLLLLLIGPPVWSVYREWKQARLDHALIVAIKAGDDKKALAALAEGASGEARENEKPPTLREALQHLRDCVWHVGMENDGTHVPALLLLNEQAYNPEKGRKSQGEATTMWEQCTVHSRNAVMAAAKLAAQSHQRQVTTEHLLFGLLAEGTIALRFLKRLKVDPEQVRAAIAASRALDTDDPDKVTTEAPTPDQQEFSPAAQRVLEFAQDEAAQNNTRAVDDVFLLIGLLREQASPASQILTRLGAGLEQVREALRILLDPDNREPFLPPDPADEMTEENIAKTLMALQHEQAKVRYEAIQRLHIFFMRAGTEDDHRLSLQAGGDTENATRSDTERLKAWGIAQKQFVQQRRIVEALQVAVDDPSAGIRICAALMLKHVNIVETEESLIRHLQNDSSKDMRAICCSGMNLTSYSLQKRDALIAALQDSHDQVVSFACTALGNLGDQQAIESLRTVLAHPAWDVRFKACEALLHLNAVDSEIVNLLESLNQEPEAAEHNRMIGKIDEFNAKYSSENEKQAKQRRTTQAVLERAQQWMQER